MDITETMKELSDIDSQGISSEDNIILHELVDQLPLDQQAVILLDVVGFKQWEISEILGISRTTVWSKRSKALTILRQKLSGGTMNGAT